MGKWHLLWNIKRGAYFRLWVEEGFGCCGKYFFGWVGGQAKEERRDFFLGCLRGYREGETEREVG